LVFEKRAAPHPRKTPHVLVTELRQMLAAHGVEYDERYVWD
jgi:hypothetical protein